MLSLTESLEKAKLQNIFDGSYTKHHRLFIDHRKALSAKDL
jgi:hypothetical protein